MLDSDGELLAAIQMTSKSLAKVISDYKTASKALDKINGQKALERQDYVAEAVAALRHADLEKIGCGDVQKEIIQHLSRILHELRANAHHALISGLTASFPNPESIKILSDSPLVIYLHPLTLEVNFEQSKAVFTYAHETLDTVSLDPDEIVSRHAELVDNFRALRVDSDRFWEICRLAYDMVLLKNGQSPGSRIDIVEMLPPLQWLWPELKGSKKISAFPKYILAYQFQKLRADKHLQAGNLRISLGSATGGSTKNKANVLYIPMGPTDGQYYLSICFQQA